MHSIIGWCRMSTRGCGYPSRTLCGHAIKAFLQQMVCDLLYFVITACLLKAARSYSEARYYCTRVLVACCSAVVHAGNDVVEMIREGDILIFYLPALKWKNCCSLYSNFQSFSDGTNSFELQGSTRNTCAYNRSTRSVAPGNWRHSSH